MNPNDRVIVKTITQGDTTEIQWGVGDHDDAVSGYIQVHPDGTATFPHGDGCVIFLAGDNTRIVEGEDSYGGVQPDERVLWHIASRRLEYIREQLRAERISQGELIELQGLAEHIEAGDVELLEPAGVPEDVAYDPDLLAAYHRAMREEDQ